MNDVVLPIIFSLPHGGLTVPEELQGRLAINDKDIFNECDLWIDDLFEFDGLAKVSTPYARALIDVNRASTDLDNPDGVVKTQTSYGRSIYKEPITNAEKQQLVDKYWRRYHAELEEAFSEYGKRADLFLDCHNMAQTGPSAYGDSGDARPLLCLANLGNRSGEIRASRGVTSCSAEYIQKAAELAEEAFSGIRLLDPLPGPQPALVAINKPYPGGPIIRDYAATRTDRGFPPGMMIEFNRGIYVGNQSAQSPITPPNTERISLIRKLTHEWLTRLTAEA